MDIDLAIPESVPWIHEEFICKSISPARNFPALQNRAQKLPESWKLVDIWRAKGMNNFYAFLKVCLFKAWRIDFYNRYRF